MPWIEHPTRKHQWARFTDDGKLVCVLTPGKEGWELTRQYLGKLHTEKLTSPSLKEIQHRIDHSLHLWQNRKAGK